MAGFSWENQRDSPVEAFGLFLEKALREAGL